MKLLFDQNISRKLVKELDFLFPNSTHVCLLGLHEAPDNEIWQYAKDNGFTIVTQDSDFIERGLVHGFPPNIIWIRSGNISTKYIKQLLIEHKEDIGSFGNGCLQIS